MVYGNRVKTLTLDIDIAVGSRIEDACGEMVALAKTLNCNVEGTFNGVRLFAVPTGDAKVLAANWTAALAKNEDRPFAHSLPGLLPSDAQASAQPP